VGCKVLAARGAAAWSEAINCKDEAINCKERSDQLRGRSGQLRGARQGRAAFM